MTEKECDFVIDAIKELISWTEYTPPYFAEKHNLEKDINEAWKAIDIIKKDK